MKFADIPNGESITSLRGARTPTMKTTEVISVDGRQAVRLPDEFRFAEEMVSVRKEGDAVILEPVKLNTWPAGFFEAIRIDDPALVRPPQGETPPAPAIESS